MDVSPISMIGDANVAERSFGKLPVIRASHRNAQCLWAVGGGNDAAIAVGLFDEMLVLFYPNLRIAIDFLVPLNRAKISRTEKNGVVLNHRLRLKSGGLWCVRTEDDKANRPYR